LAGADIVIEEGAWLCENQFERAGDSFVSVNGNGDDSARAAFIADLLIDPEIVGGVYTLERRSVAHTLGAESFLGLDAASG
jgi:hypothetical protein